MDKKNKIHPFEVQDTDVNKKEENQQDNSRENWGGKFDFFFSALSYSGS